LTAFASPARRADRARAAPVVAKAERPVAEQGILRGCPLGYHGVAACAASAAPAQQGAAKSRAELTARGSAASRDKAALISTLLGHPNKEG